MSEPWTPSSFFIFVRKVLRKKLFYARTSLSRKSFSLTKGGRAMVKVRVLGEKDDRPKINVRYFIYRASHKVNEESVIFLVEESYINLDNRLLMWVDGVGKIIRTNGVADVYDVYHETQGQLERLIIRFYSVRKDYSIAPIWEDGCTEGAFQEEFHLEWEEWGNANNMEVFFYSNGEPFLLPEHYKEFEPKPVGTLCRKSAGG